MCTGKRAATPLLLLGNVIIYKDPEQTTLNKAVGGDHTPHQVFVVNLCYLLHLHFIPRLFYFCLENSVFLLFLPSCSLCTCLAYPLNKGCSCGGCALKANLLGFSSFHY